MLAAQAPTPRGVAMPHLRAWRLWAGLTLAELSERAGVTLKTAWHAEKTVWHLQKKTTQRLATALGIPVDVLTRYAPSDAEAERWAREVAVTFARERMGRQKRIPISGRIGR